MKIKRGKYIHFEGTEFEVLGTVTHSESHEKMVLYRGVNGDKRVWVCPVSTWLETVEHDGRETKRFIHEDDFVKEPSVIASTVSTLNHKDLQDSSPKELLHQKPITHESSSRSSLFDIDRSSTPEEKFDLFLSLFSGRESMFAKRWENTKKGISGYAPVCNNEWSPICPKSIGGGIRCGDCANQDFLPFDTQAVQRHLMGQLTVGVYPMLLDETCRFLVFDFDGKDYNPEALMRDVNAIRDICIDKQISMAVERSRSGRGFHFWIFFNENILASTARKFGSSLITYTMSKHHELSFKSYDRMIPAQDTLPKGGFGNLIALPLQRRPREQGNSIFVDEDYIAYTDQWKFLSSIKKYSLEDIEHFIRELAPSGELGNLRKDEDDEKPWVKKTLPTISNADFPETVSIIRSNMLYIRKEGISSTALNTMKRLAAFHNPEFYKAQAMRLSTYNKPRIILCSDETEQYLCLPRGLDEELTQILTDCGAHLNLINKVNEGRTIDVSFNGILRDEQKLASNALLMHNNGILSATTAFGKTVIGAHLIAERKVNILVLVHRTSLLSQWIAQLSQFLIVNEEPIPEYTPTGRKKKKNIIGQIGGGKNAASGIIDVAVMQSLVSGDEVKELVKNYGMIIVDECHHVSAFSFEQVLKAANAKYVYGLTATPTRKDGHHPIIYMHCGKIRYKVDAKSQASLRPFKHFIIPRFTRFQKATSNDDDKWTITDIYRDIQNNEIRNTMIIQDVITAVEEGRNPIILTERTAHVKELSARLSPYIQNTISMTGGASNKAKRELLGRVSTIPDNEPFVLVATGKYVGEGFDMPRLDTLFLTMPVSWKGTVQQYAGRLHRTFEGKSEVQIYDYVDIRVPMLERMYQKRLKGYASIGYEAKGAPHSTEDTSMIYDSSNFINTFTKDIQSARQEILIVSPFLTKRRVLSALTYLPTTDTPITIVTKPLDNYSEKDRARVNECINILKRNNITVKTKDSVHEKFTIIDQHISWYGSINLLGYGTTQESIMRIGSSDIASELAGLV